MTPNPEIPVGLPAPDAISAAHSERVAAHIADRIRDAGGSISFANFMHEALYAPGLGYYAAGSQKFGADGDFVTAPELSPLFGYVIARQSAEVLDAIGGGDIFEPGAGSGALAISVLSKLEELEALPDRYLLLEVSADLKERQLSRLQEEAPRFLDRVHWVSSLPESFSGVVIANEVADAIAAERFRIEDGRVLQARVGERHNAFDWQFDPAPDFLEAAVREIEEDLGRPLATGYESEVSPGLTGWVGDLAERVRHGVILLIDYGLSRREYYAPDRGSGWLRCHFRHHAHDDPLILPGIQDITAWVDFTAVAAAAVAKGMRVAGYASQAHFLMYGGLDVELAAFGSWPVERQVELSGQVRKLTLPGEMGENFKCIALGSGDVAGMSAFAVADRAHLL